MKMTSAGIESSLQSTEQRLCVKLAGSLVCVHFSELVLNTDIEPDGRFSVVHIKKNTE